MGRIRTRGFLLKHRVATLFRRFFRRRNTPSTYLRLSQPRSNRVKSFERFCNWTQRLRMKAKAIISKNMEVGRDYVRVGQEPVLEKPVPVPKGHVAVYVGQKDGEFERVLVPVVYCNHPLFGDLLKESEKEYGFDHPGGITIPVGYRSLNVFRPESRRVGVPRSCLGGSDPVGVGRFDGSWILFFTMMMKKAYS